MSAKLFVGNLSFNITENELQDAFAAHGTVVEANLMMDRATGRPRGFGFVTMSTPEEAQKAIDALNTQLTGITVLKGAEVNITKDGTLDIDDATLAQLDVVGVAVHSHFNRLFKKLKVTTRTQLVLRMMQELLCLTISELSGLPPICRNHANGKCPFKG